MNARRLKTLLALASMAALVLAGCDPLPGRPTLADLPLRPSDVTDFATLYGENCAGCHGADGKSGAAIAMNNPVYLAIIDDVSMRRVIAGGVPGTSMPPFAQSAGGDLTDRQIDLLVAGIRKSWSGPAGAGVGAPPYAAASAGDPNRGAQVYAANCQACHGAGGKGGPSAGSIVDASYLALVSDQYLRTIVIAGRPDLGHPDWKQYASGPLTSEQVSDVVAWLGSQRKASVAGVDAEKKANLTPDPFPRTLTPGEDAVPSPAERARVIRYFKRHRGEGEPEMGCVGCSIPLNPPFRDGKGNQKREAGAVGVLSPGPLSNWKGGIRQRRVTNNDA